MKRDDYLQAFTSGLLALSGEPAAAALAYLGERFELQEPRKTGVVSLGGRGPDGRELSYTEWVRALREEQVRAVRFSWGAEPVDPALPPHVASAFAGVQILLFQVLTASATRTYGLRTLHGPQQALDPAHFLELINAQERKEPLWERVRELIHASNEMNGRSALPPGRAPEYLLSREGAEVYDYLAPELCREVQVECRVMETPFRIPPHLQDAFVPSRFSFGLPERDSVFLYPEKQPITPEALRALIQAQPLSSTDIWARADAQLREAQDPALLPPTAHAWPTALEGLSPQVMENATHAVCAAIRSLCEEQLREPIIPEALKESFGPNPLEQKRARARSRLSGSQWFLQGNPHPWQLLFFEQVANTPSGEALAAPSRLKTRFQEALRAIEAFAVRQDSPFAEAFRLGRFLLEPQLPPGDLDETHGQRIAKALAAQGFSERARENFSGVFSFTEDLKTLHWSAERILGFLAVTVSDVFGGMGSWNDMPVQEDDGQYERLSADLFRAMKDYSAALLSWTREVQ